MESIDNLSRPSNSRKAQYQFPFLLINGAIGVLLLIFMLQSYYLYKRSSESDKWVIHTNEVLKTIRDINIYIKAADAANRGFILTRNPSFMEEYIVSTDHSIKAVTKLAYLTKDNKIQAGRLKELAALMRERKTLTTQLSTIFPPPVYSGKAPAIPSGLIQINNSIESTIQSLEDTEDQLLEERSLQNRINSRQRLLFSIGAFSLIVLFLILIVFKIRQAIKKKAIAEALANVQEEKYKTLVEESGVSMVLVDRNGVIKMSSRNLTDLLGFETGELKGKKFIDLVSQQYNHVLTSILSPEPGNAGYNNIVEFRIQTKAGTEKLVSCRATSTPVNAANEREWQLIMWDIDEDQKMQMELKALQSEAREHQKLVQDIIDNIPLIVFIKDTKGRYRIINNSMQASLGLPPSEIIGRSDRQFNMDPESLRKYISTDEKVLQEKKIVSLEDVVEINSERRYLWVTKLPLLNEKNEVKYICGIASDITAFKEVELKLIEAKEDAEDARAAQEVFLANISHEIRTPMNGILGMTNLLMDTSLDRDQKEFSESIRESARSLLVLINDLLDISKVKSGKFQLESIPFKVEEIVRKAVYPLQFKAKEKKIDLNLNFTDELEGQIVGDPLRLQQIIINLAGNAIKFTQRGAVNIGVSTKRLGPDDINLRVEIRDTGIGIPVDRLKDIFESYTQSNINTTRIYGGTGLGLTIVKQLIELQNGTMSVSSIPGEGSVFSFEIVYKISIDNVSMIENSGNVDKTNIMKGLNILVAEDNLINQKVVKYTLQKAGADVTVVLNGLEAINELKKHYYDLVLMDMQMPEMDGYQATRYIREELKSTIPVIAMTANALRGEAEKCMEAGATGYISKPFDPATLCESILQLTTKVSQIPDNKAETEEGPLVDLSYVMELAGDKGDYLKQVLTIFMDNTPQGLEDLERLIYDTEDWQAISTQAHYLKSSVGIIKIRGMHEWLQQIETRSKEAPDKAELTGLMDKLIATFSQAKPVILQELEKDI